MKSEKSPEIKAAGIVMLVNPVIPVVALALNRILFSAWLKLKSVMLVLLRVTTV